MTNFVAAAAARDEPLLALIADAVAAACLIVDPATDFVVTGNSAAAQMFGIEDVAGLKFSRLHPGFLDQVVVFAEEVVDRGASWTRRIEGRHARGQQMQLEYEARAFDTDRGLRLVFIAADLEERSRRNQFEEADGLVRGGLLEWNRLERLFRQTERLNDLILSSAGDGIYGVDPDGLTTFVNDAAEQMLGWSATDLIGRNMHDLIHHHHADGRAYPAAECPIYNAFRHAQVNFVEDEIFWHKDGHALRVEYSSNPILEGSSVLGAVIIFRDITERKENERRLQDALTEVERLRQRLEMENAYLQEEIRNSRNHHEIIGVSDAISETVQQIELVAPTNANVLIIGESGTGKELVAQAIHADSPRADRPLIRVNCAAIPRDLFESEFFGHVKGAFTGALRDRIGRFELADGGTLFLDEVGEIPLELQGKLLRVLQERSFERIGEAETRAIDVRIIAATNRDMVEAVAKGQFREDLFFRLNVFPIYLTPLRDRPEDIAPLAAHFLKLACSQLNLSATSALSRANVADLIAYPWPGNARELGNIIERAVILARGRKLVFDLPKAKDMDIEREPKVVPTEDAPIETEAERRARQIANIKTALRASQGKVAGAGGAAERLGVKPTTLYSRLRRLGLQRPVRLD